MKIKQKGGKVIASGGFVCIVEPALSCDNNVNNENKSSNRSKLMTIKNATDEHKQIDNLK